MTGADPALAEAPYPIFCHGLQPEAWNALPAGTG